MTELWSRDRAWTWYEAQPWMLGFNYVPRTAVNTVDMWQAETFDPDTIRQELAMASGLGFNACRVFLQYLVWKVDPHGAKERLDRFLGIASENGLHTVCVLLEDCGFGSYEPFMGAQPLPAPGIHNSRWVPSPNLAGDRSPSALPLVKKYVMDIVASFRSDERIWMWDLFNEPDNGDKIDQSVGLVAQAFCWARECDAVQPLSTSVYGAANESEAVAARLSDVNGLHCYERPSKVMAEIRGLEAFGRPIICTEWLHRQNGNDFRTVLPILEERKIASFHWGLYAGKTQTYLSWDATKNPKQGYPAIWQHDLLYPDGTAYDPEELELVRRAARRSRGTGKQSTAIGEE
jgi:hypothetical protein